ncbi:MAG: saccharopine dehydrogenase C-terminal domain-containing protein [Phycisphaerales bacterium JB038]
MARMLVLGSGMVGSVIAADLSADADHQVTVADVNAEALERLRARHALETIQADLSQPGSIDALATDFDVIIGALPSRFGYRALAEVIAAAKPYVDISFMPEDFLELSALAQERGVTAVVDCGVAPGMSNLLVGYGYRQLDCCDNIEIYVGGLPLTRSWPYEYKAGFAPSDVIEEYTRPARLVEHGEIVIREALSEPELMDFAEVGTLEAFNTDGLRSLADTLKAPFMKEKTLRYPGHIELMRVLRETGLFREDEIEVGGVQVKPLDVISTLMFPKWTFEEGEADLTVMRIIVEGEQAGARQRYRWDLFDCYDPQTNWRSMSRTTGFPAAIMARMLAAGRIEQSGVLPPELLADDESLVRDMLAELARRGVSYEERTETL